MQAASGIDLIRPHMIGIVEPPGSEAHNIEVPEGMMNDIVRPLWASQVRVNGIRTGSRIILDDIWLDE